MDLHPFLPLTVCFTFGAPDPCYLCNQGGDEHGERQCGVPALLHGTPARVGLSYLHALWGGPHFWNAQHPLLHSKKGGQQLPG